MDGRVPCPGEIQSPLPAALPLGPPGELAVAPSLSRLHLPDFRRTRRRQGVCILGALARSAPNEAARSAPCLVALADPGPPPPPFPRAAGYLCVCTDPHTPHRWSERARAWDPPVEGLLPEAGCLPQSPVLRMLAGLSADLSSQVQTPKGGPSPGRAVSAVTDPEEGPRSRLPRQTSLPAPRGC